MATLTYVYAESTAVLSPLSPAVEPHCYDLCAAHSRRLTAPRGWEVVHVELPSATHQSRPVDDLEALALAVRVATARTQPPAPGEGLVEQLRAQGHVVSPQQVSSASVGVRRGHLSAVPSLE